MAKRIGFLVSHPIQYYAPIFRELARRCDLTVFFAHRQTPEQQATRGLRRGLRMGRRPAVGLRQPLSRPMSRASRRPTASPAATRRASPTRSRAASSTPSSCRAGRCAPTGRRCGRAGASACRCWCAAIRNSAASAAASSESPRRWLFRACCAASTGSSMSGRGTANICVHYGVPAERLFFSPHCVDNDAFRRRQRAAFAARNGRRASRAVRRQADRPQSIPPTCCTLSHGCGDEAVEVAFAGSGELEAELRKIAAAVVGSC